jgi:hypothetical protein
VQEIHVQKGKRATLLVVENRNQRVSTDIQPVQAKTSKKKALFINALSFTNRQEKRSGLK